MIPTIGVCDTGKPQLPGIVMARDFVGRGVDDRNGHSTLMCRLMRRECPHCLFVVAKVCRDDGKYLDYFLAYGIRWCASQGCQVVNVSLVPASGRLVDEAIAYARNRGVIVIVADKRVAKPSDAAAKASGKAARRLK